MNSNQAELGSPESKANSLDDPLESEQFYNLMQSYRVWPIYRQKEVIDAFEAVKTFIREQVKP